HAGDTAAGAAAPADPEHDHDAGGVAHGVGPGPGQWSRVRPGGAHGGHLRGRGGHRPGRPDADGGERTDAGTTLPRSRAAPRRGPPGGLRRTPRCPQPHLTVSARRWGQPPADRTPTYPPHGDTPPAYARPVAWRVAGQWSLRRTVLLSLSSWITFRWSLRRVSPGWGCARNCSARWPISATRNRRRSSRRRFRRWWPVTTWWGRRPPVPVRRRRSRCLCCRR